MERYAWKAQVLDGQLEEYKRRHAALWPELKAVLKEAGISNYTIWNVGNDLFGYYECEKGVEYAARVQAGSPVVDRWNAYMKDVMSWRWTPAPRPAPPRAGFLSPLTVYFRLIIHIGKGALRLEQ